MPSTFTDSLRLEEQGIGENDNTWGNKLNSTIRMTDRAIAGHVSVAVVSGDVVLTSVNNAEDEARYRIIELTGTLTGNVNVQVPEVSKEYIVWDSTTRGGFTLNFRLGAAGNTVVIPATTTRAFGISTDGTDWRPLSANLASETAPGIVEFATDGEAQTGTATDRALTPANLQAVTATETRKGVVELSTDAEAQTGTDTARALTPANLQAVTATETRKGVAEVATEAEARTGTDNTTIITPLRLQSVTATETRKGVIEIATQPEVDTGTDDSRAVTPLKLDSHLDSRLGTAATLNVGTGSGQIPRNSDLGTAAQQAYEEIDVTLTNHFDNVPVRFTRVGTLVTVTFMEEPGFTGDRVFHQAQNFAVPSSMRNVTNTNPIGTVCSYFGIFGEAYVVLVRLRYVVNIHSFQIEFERTDNVAYSTAIGAGAGRPSLTWNTGA